MMNTHMKKRYPAAVLLIIIVMLTLLSPIASALQAKIVSNSAAIYQYPSYSARKVSGFGGVTVNVIGWQNGWARIKRGSRVAYIPIRNLKLVKSIAGWTKNTAKVYNANGRAIGSVPAGTKVYVNGYNNGYCRVTAANGTKSGYIRLRDLSKSAPSTVPVTPTPAPEPADSGSTKIDRVLTLAKAQLGKPYNTPGNPPNNFDCSSLVRYCYNAVGYDVGRTAQIQGYNSRLTKVTYANLRAGDILCFNTVEDDDDLSDHTALYLGNGSFIHASENAGKVRIDYFNNYYREHLSWARRVIN